jgi:hypothetical protein
MKFTLIKDLLPMFKEKLEKFVKKYKIDYVYEESDSYICEDKESPRFGLYLVDINVEAEYKLGDYSFVASLEWVDEAKENLIKKASEDTYVPVEYKTRRECDHCGTNRYRKSTVLLKSNETGEYQEEERFIMVGNVLEVGPECKWIAEGDVVMWAKPSEVAVPFFKQGLVIVNENRIIVTVNEGLKKRFNNGR